MNLKFVCHEGFTLAGGICARVQEYLPNLVRDTEIIRTEAFKGVFETRSILPMIERLIQPDWERDIVFVIIDGSLYLADLELFEAAYTLDQLILKEGRMRPFSESPRLGAQLLPRNMPEELRGDPGYWAKVGVEELLHPFGVPEQHDVNCFFHPKGCEEKLSIEDSRKDYCPRCRRLMLELEAPLDFAKLSARVEGIYGLRPRIGRGK